jgi:hypothetical protein
VTSNDRPADATDLDSLAALLQADARDAKVFFPVLCEKLLGALPDAAVVEREHSLRKRNRVARKITLRLGDDTFEAEMAGDIVSCRHVHAVRGVGGGMPFNRQLELDDWIAAVVASLAHQAQTSAAATAALRALVT